MQKIILTLLVFISFNSFGQNRIEGIGKFKLKKTSVTYLDTLAKEQGLDREKINTFKEYYNLRRETNKLAEIFVDTVERYNSPSYSHYCKDARVFYIPKMKISEIELSNTYLTFYKDTLVEINTDYEREITEAFELKYGKAEIEKKEKEIKCTLKLSGAEISYTEIMYYQYWNNGNIRCTAALGDYYNSKCEKQSISYISLSVEKMTTKIRECDDKEEDRIKKKNDSEKKKKLDDF
jgi:hypothetical protein